MPLALDEVFLDRLADRPLYKQLADLVRDAIAAGLLVPGEYLPGETELARSTGISRYAVRDALDVLVAEGRIVKAPGVPAKVARPPRARHMATDRYQRQKNLLRQLDETGAEHPETSAFTEDYRVEWTAYRVQTNYVEEPATATDADHLQIPQGTLVLRRRLLKLVEGEPVQIQVSVMPLDLVAGTPVADPDRQPWPGGTLAELHLLRQDVTRVSEAARARFPTDVERRELRMEAAGPVMEVVRVFSTGKGRERRPVEYSTVVVAATTIVLEFETDLD